MVKLLKYSILTALLAFAITAQAQVAIDIDEKINEKLRIKNASIDSTKTSGYRIQIAFSTDKSVATAAAIKFKSKFPQYAGRVYTIYQQPYWKVRVCDYYRQIDAIDTLNEVLIYFPKAYLVRDYVKRPIIE